MNKTVISGIDIEDCYGNAVENIELARDIEIDLGEIDFRVTNFSFIETYKEEGSMIARLQYNLEKGNGDQEEMYQIHSELLEVLLECSDGELDEEEISEKILVALEILI